MSDTETEIRAPRKLKLSGEWIWRLVAGALLVLNLWVKSNYVSKEDYDKDRRQTGDAIVIMTKNIQELTIRSEVNARQDKTLDDHESRIRHLETR